MQSLPKSERYSGQAVLLVLLAMSVIVTVALSIVSRSVTDISNSNSQESSARAFAAAEAGVEKALIANTNTTGTLNNANFTATVSSTGAALTDYNYPIALSSGDTGTIWFVQHDANGNLTCNGSCFSGSAIKVCWGAPGTSAASATTPALELSFYSTPTPLDFTTGQVSKIGIDPNIGRGNGFIAPDAGVCSIAGKSYQFQKTIYFSQNGFSLPGFTILNIGFAYGSIGGLIDLKAKLLYNTDVSHNIGVTENGIPLLILPGTYPSQGNNITSAGSSGNANRKLQVFQGFDEPPSVFESVVYSNGALTK